MQIILLNNFTLIADDQSMFDWLLSQLTDMQVNDYTIMLVVWMILLSRGQPINPNRFWDGAFVYQLKCRFHYNKSPRKEKPLSTGTRYISYRVYLHKV